MTPAAFATAYSPDAQLAAARTGVPWQTILAQWADETGYATSAAFTAGNNFAGVSPGGSVAAYQDQAAGLSAYITTLNNPLYNGVRTAAAQGPQAAAVALGQSPWAASKYDASGGGPGSDLVNILNTIGAAETAQGPQTASVWGTLGGLGAAASNIPGDIAGLIPGVPSALGTGIAGDVASSIANDLIGLAKKPAITAVFVTAALGLVVLGLWRMVAPTVKPALEQAQDVATKAAEAGAVA